MKYKKIYIIGPNGAGKTTLARKLSKQLGCPHFELDWVKYDTCSGKIRPSAERNEILDHILTDHKTWIIDGSQWYNWTDKIWHDCDIAVIDIPPLMTRIYRIMCRALFHHAEKNLPFMREMRNIVRTIMFRKFFLPKYISHATKNHKKIIDANDFLRGL